MHPDVRKIIDSELTKNEVDLDFELRASTSGYLSRHDTKLVAELLHERNSDQFESHPHPHLAGFVANKGELEKWGTKGGGIYLFVRAKPGDVLKIGCTMDFAKRLKWHLRRP